ncbi:MAG: hypothetical protein CL693_19835 [Cellvibrionaceae bacterium]|nr:hypothetical protein [Cellvibrionaceae bacterium]|tara:strand:+ start:17121 stop:17861 length:741 start_codon:yes stop_codon:yes gene_type:complete
MAPKTLSNVAPNTNDKTSAKTRKNTRSKKSLSPVTLRLAVKSNDGVLVYTDYGKQLLQWRDASSSQKIQAFHDCWFFSGEGTTVALTINLTESATKAILTKESLEYPRSVIRKQFQSFLKAHGYVDFPILFFFTPEQTNNAKNRLHLHGTLVVPDSLTSDFHLAFLEKTIGGSLNKKYKRKSSTRTKIKSGFQRNSEGPEKPVSRGWASYCHKSKVYRLRDFAVSRELRGLAESYWEEVRTGGANS